MFLVSNNLKKDNPSSNFQVLLSIEQFPRALELMLSMRQYDRAACFAEAMIEFELWQPPEKVSVRFAPFLSFVVFLFIDSLSCTFIHSFFFPFIQFPCDSKDIPPEVTLTRTAFLEYGRLLLTVGNVCGARHYATRAGSSAGNGAETLLKDVGAVQTAFLQNAKEKKGAKA